MPPSSRDAHADARRGRADKPRPLNGIPLRWLCSPGMRTLQVLVGDDWVDVPHVDFGGPLVTKADKVEK